MSLKDCFLILTTLFLTAKSKPSRISHYDFPEFPTFDDFFSDFWSGNDFTDEMAEASFHNYEHHYGKKFPDGGHKRETLLTVKCSGGKCKHRMVTFPGVIHSEKKIPLEDDIIGFPSFFSRKWKSGNDDRGYETFDYWKSGSEQKNIWNKHRNTFGEKHYAKSSNSKHYQSVIRNNNKYPIVSGMKSGSEFHAFGLRKKPRDLGNKTPQYNKHRSRNRDLEGREDRKPSVSQQRIYFKPTINIKSLNTKTNKESEERKVFESNLAQKTSCFDSEECENEKIQTSGNSSQYYKRNQQGPGSYRFGYRQLQNKDLHYRKEKRDSIGQISGKYGYRLPDGQRREVKYWVDKTGDFHQKTHIL